MYKTNLERDVATIQLINQGLEENRLCIFASVFAYYEPHLARFRSKIKDYEENIKKRNLLIVNLKPFYESAKHSDLTLFEKFKIQIQQELERRNNKYVVVVADCADNLFQNQYFDQTEEVERWWHCVYMDWMQHENQGQNHITIVCPHLDSRFCNHPFDIHKYKIFDNHSVAIDAAGHLIMGSSTRVKRVEPQRQIANPPVSLTDSQTQILVAEPEPDLQQIYDIWLRSMGFKNILITDSGTICLGELLKIESKSNVITILDSHLRDIPVLELARQIANKKPHSRIILTTTLPPDSIDSIDNSNNTEILMKPFSFSELLPLIINNIE